MNTPAPSHPRSTRSIVAVTVVTLFAVLAVVVTVGFTAFYRDHRASGGLSFGRMSDVDRTLPGNHLDSWDLREVGRVSGPFSQTIFTSYQDAAVPPFDLAPEGQVEKLILYYEGRVSNGRRYTVQATASPAHEITGFTLPRAQSRRYFIWTSSPTPSGYVGEPGNPVDAFTSYNNTVAVSIVTNAHYLRPHNFFEATDGHFETIARFAAELCQQAVMLSGAVSDAAIAQEAVCVSYGVAIGSKSVGASYQAYLDYTREYGSLNVAGKPQWLPLNPAVWRELPTLTLL